MFINRVIGLVARPPSPRLVSLPVEPESHSGPRRRAAGGAPGGHGSPWRRPCRTGSAAVPSSPGRETGRRALPRPRIVALQAPADRSGRVNVPVPPAAVTGPRPVRDALSCATATAAATMGGPASSLPPAACRREPAKSFPKKGWPASLWLRASCREPDAWRPDRPARWPRSSSSPVPRTFPPGADIVAQQRVRPCGVTIAPSG